MADDAEIHIEQTRPDTLEIAELIAERVAHSHATVPLQSIHTLDLEALNQPNVLFWAARLNDGLVGCGALKLESGGLAELKSMFVRPQARGRGVSKRILSAIESEAGRLSVSRINLETGVDSHAARRLYESFGYVYCEPFGSYAPDPLCVFMTKRIKATSPGRSGS